MTFFHSKFLFLVYARVTPSDIHMDKRQLCLSIFSQQGTRDWAALGRGGIDFDRF